MTTGFESLLLPKGAQAPASYRWGTVTAVSPLAVQLDGDSSPLPVPPATLVERHLVGDRVWCQVYNRQVVVLGRKDGTNKDPEVWRRLGSTERTADTAAAPGVTTTFNILTYTIPVAYCVAGTRFRITYTGHVNGNTVGTYCDVAVRLGVNANTGGTTLEGQYVSQHVASRTIPFERTFEYVYGTWGEANGASPQNLVVVGIPSSGSYYATGHAQRKTAIFVDVLAQ